jgi:hypothetical protein
MGMLLLIIYRRMIKSRSANPFIGERRPVIGEILLCSAHTSVQMWIAAPPNIVTNPHVAKGGHFRI